MRIITRRSFLHNSLAVAAASGLPAFAPQGSVSPNEVLRIAVLGVRGRGQAHVGAFAAMKDVHVAVVCDPDSTIVKPAMDLAEKKSGRKAEYVPDLRKVLGDKSIDAISVATPNHWHVLASLWAVQAGKDVYVEKPLGQNFREGKKLVEAARKYDRLVQQGNTPRSASGTRKAMAFLHSGKLGKVKVARGICYNPRKSIGKKSEEAAPGGVDYDLWTGPAPLRPFTRNRFHYNWHWNWEFGNGELGNNGIYQMDIARWGLGKDGLPSRVFSLGGRYGYEDDGETPNTQVTFLDYGDVHIVHEVRGLDTDPYRKVSMGNIFDCAEGTMVFGNAGIAAYSPSGEIIEKFVGEGDHFRNFVDAVKTRRRQDLNSEVLEGHLSTALCHLGNVSFRLGETRVLGDEDLLADGQADVNETADRFRKHLHENEVDLSKVKTTVGKVLAFDPKGERFVGEPAADALLRREYRKPFVVPDQV